MTATTRSIHALAHDLARQLAAAYAHDAPAPAGGDPLRELFDQFGRDAAEATISLEDAMAAGVEVLQGLFDGAGGGVDDPSTTLAAGIALAALSRGHHEASEHAKAGEPVLAEAPTPWLAALHHINRAATANLELASGLESSVRVVTQTTGADACALFLYDEASDTLTLRAAVGLNPAAIGATTLRRGLGITGLAAKERRVIAAADARQHPASTWLPNTGEDLYSSQVSVPMIIRRATDDDHLVGVLNIFALKRRVFSEDELAFLQSVADELAITIENARLYSLTDARLRRKVTELSTLQRVSHTIASTLNLDDVLRLIAEQAIELFDAESAAIFRLPSRRSGLEATTIEHYVGQHRDLVNPMVREDAVREVVRTGAPHAIDLDYPDGSNRLICLPLRSAREMLGALCIRLDSEEATLSEDELSMLQAFSDAAPMAIENATLYQETRLGLETASALLQEMHHRVRNNLQTVAALLSLQVRRSGEGPWAAHLNEAIARIQSIAAVHDLLSDESRLGGTTIAVLAQHVADEALHTLIRPGLTVRFEIVPSDVGIPSRQATIVALLINELVANAVNHGFAGKREGTVRITSEEKHGVARIEVTNDGHRLDEGFDPSQSHGLGMRIIQRLVTSDLKGTFSIGNGGLGTVATIEFPID